MEAVSVGRVWGLRCSVSIHCAWRGAFKIKRTTCQVTHLGIMMAVIVNAVAGPW
jgi:hypothetical protein